MVAAKTAPADGYTPVVLSLSTIGQPIQQEVGYAEIVQTLQDAFKFSTEQPAFLQMLDGGALRPWYMPASEFLKFADKVKKDQRTLLGKYGFAERT